MSARLSTPDKLGVARRVEATFRVKDDLYLLGGMERGVTLYNQHVRAHNLAWALWELENAGVRNLGSVAVIGAGASGLTAAAGILGLFEGAKSITLFEQLWDLCPLQQGADSRWLHPRLYNWPEPGSRAPTASLPVLNWSEGRASDVARTIVGEFGRYCDKFARNPASLSVILGLRYFQIDASTQEIAWIGTQALRDGPFFRTGASEGRGARFDTIIFAAGFGLERSTAKFPIASYWRNEQIGQPLLDGQQARYVVSGYGDGALVDLCRLTIERFRQDTIIYELFGDVPDLIENKLYEDIQELGSTVNLYEYFVKIDETMLGNARQELARRLRKDTFVALHLSGKSGKTKSIREIFGPTSSKLSRLLAYLLYRCGAYTVGFHDLGALVRRHNAPIQKVLCRHGTDTRAHISAMITNYVGLPERLNEMRDRQDQVPVPLWSVGAFPNV